MTLWITLISAIAALITAIAGVISSWRGHLVVNNEVKPAQEATARAVLKVAEDSPTVDAAEVKQIINGAAGDHQPG